jgi:protein-L-isoaspartate(D-aspartate) O-methyltransferase
MRDLAYSRYIMVERHLRSRGVTDPRVLGAMQEIPRESFVQPGMEEFAYEDAPLAIGEGQTISQPFIVGLMIDKAELEDGDAVLEIGTGSGYAAAVLSRIVGHVYTMERLAPLADQAQRRFKRLGYHNIVVRTGDGTLGWPDAAPFNAILVAAGAPAVPDALKTQLAMGGRLVIPIGGEDEQRLLQITRTGTSSYEEDDLGAVCFVPLVGAQGWQKTVSASVDHQPPFSEIIRSAAEPLPDPQDPAFGQAFDRFANKRIVMLGESTHGTSEFYRARAAITRHLIEHHGFTIVAFEADWPDMSELNRYVRGIDTKVYHAPFQRFPTWMWRNQEVSDFMGWLREHNDRITAPANKAGCYGLDLYNMSASIDAVLRYLDQNDREAARIARERYGCLTPWQEDPSTYGRSVLTGGYTACEEKIIAQCREMLVRQFELRGVDDEDLLDAAQSARLVATAERYYRVMYYGGAESWNLRDTHMFETLDQLLKVRGPQSKAIVWAHNSHIGDARHTDMGSFRDEVSIGQLCRQAYGPDVALIGFGTHSGQVAAASDWDEPMEIKDIRPALADSYEDLFHEAGLERALVDLAGNPDLAQRLAEPRLERFIGVIYRPETERASHYMHASLGRQFDAFVWFDETKPVKSLAAPRIEAGDDLYPFGL